MVEAYLELFAFWSECWRSLCPAVFLVFCILTSAIAASTGLKH